MSIQVRLRKPLRYYHRDDLLVTRMQGGEFPDPRFTVPARTTLTVVDFPTADFRALCFTPSGQRIFVDRKTLRDHGYTPRASREKDGQ